MEKAQESIIIEGKQTATMGFMHDKPPIMSKKKKYGFFPFNRIMLILICMLLLSTSMLFMEIENQKGLGQPGRIVIAA